MEVVVPALLTLSLITSDDQKKALLAETKVNFVNVRGNCAVIRVSEKVSSRKQIRLWSKRHALYALIF